MKRILYMEYECFLDDRAPLPNLKPKLSLRDLALARGIPSELAIVL